MNLKVKKLYKDSKLPTRNLSSDAGLDIYSYGSFLINKNSTVKICTGISIYIPKGHFGKIEARSSMASKGLIVSAGVIDSGYTGELVVIMHNLDDYYNYIESGDKIAQLIIHPIKTPKVKEVKTIKSSKRGSKGFGSSGK